MPTQNILTGRFFHTLHDGVINWQGEVLGQVHEDVFLVQLFEWVMGEPNIQKAVRLAEMEEWVFYASQEEMNRSYEHGYAAMRREKKSKAKDER